VCTVLLQAFIVRNPTGCGSLLEVVSLSIQEVVSSSPACAGRVKPKTFKIGCDCSFAKSTTFRSENHGSFGYDLKNGGPVSQYLWHVKEPSLLKAVSAKHRSICSLVTGNGDSRQIAEKFARATQNKHLDPNTSCFNFTTSEG
jgi:hypothetical protein